MPKFSRKQIILFASVLAVSASLGFLIIHLTAPKVRNDGTHNVELRSNGAIPTAIAIVKGSYVEFDTKDGRSHNIYEGGGHAHSDNSSSSSAGPESGVFGPGSGYRVTFSQTGTYEFHDHLHDNIAVTVIVYESKKK
ncbi:MAG: plastocyanin/azurin family copper-binding protein [Candidatus Saccharibacteria bacterium]